MEQELLAPYRTKTHYMEVTLNSSHILKQKASHEKSQASTEIAPFNGRIKCVCCEG